MKQTWRVIVLTMSTMIIGTAETSFAVSPVVAGAATAGGSYAIAKVMQQVHNNGPQILKNVISCDHFGALAMILALGYAINWHTKKHLAPITDEQILEKHIKEYMTGLIASLLGVIALEAYLTWTGDWRTTLFPTFFEANQ